MNRCFCGISIGIFAVNRSVFLWYFNRCFCDALSVPILLLHKVTLLNKVDVWHSTMPAVNNAASCTGQRRYLRCHLQVLALKTVLPCFFTASPHHSEATLSFRQTGSPHFHGTSAKKVLQAPFPEPYDTKSPKLDHSRLTLILNWLCLGHIVE